MIEYFAAHKVAVMIGLAAVALVFVLRARGAKADDLPAYPVNPYSSTPPSRGDGSGSLALPLPGPIYGSGVAGSSGDAAGQGAGPSVADASTSTGPGAGPTMALASYMDSPTIQANGIDYGGTDSAYGTSGGDVIAFAPQQATYNPIYTPSEPVIGGFDMYGIVGTTGTVSDPSPYAAPDRSPQSVQGAVALVDPSGHVVNAKGARVGGFAGD